MMSWIGVGVMVVGFIMMLGGGLWWGWTPLQGLIAFSTAIAGMITAIVSAMKEQ